MKITAIKTFLMQAGPTRSGKPGAAIAPSLDDRDTKLPGSRNWLFVRIETDEGISGIGECSGWPRILETAIKDLTPLLVGEDPFHIERIAQKIQVAIMAHGSLGTVGGGVLTGIDLALWDIKGKALDTPVWNLLGGKLRDRIPIYTHANSIEFANSARDRGIKIIKCAGGGGIDQPVRKIARLREALGDDVDIAVDLHGPSWLTPIDAARLARALEPYNLLWLEDPISPDNIDGYKRIRDAADVPLAAGERFAGVFGERELIEQGLVDIIQPDTGRAGGLTQMKKIAALAEAHHVMVAPHSGSLGPVAEYAALHLMASIPNALVLERIEDDWEGRSKTVLPHPVQTNGSLEVPNTVGLGCDIDEDFVARYPCHTNLSVPASVQFPDGSSPLYVKSHVKRGRYFSPRGDDPSEGSQT